MYNLRFFFFNVTLTVNQYLFNIWINYYGRVLEVTYLFLKLQYRTIKIHNILFIFYTINYNVVLNLFSRRFSNSVFDAIQRVRCSHYNMRYDWYASLLLGRSETLQKRNYIIVYTFKHFNFYCRYYYHAMLFSLNHFRNPFQLYNFV